MGSVGEVWLTEVKGHGVLEALSLGVARAGTVIDSESEEAPASSGSISKSESSADSSSLSIEASPPSRSETWPDEVKEGDREGAGGVLEWTPLADMIAVVDGLRVRRLVSLGLATTNT